MTTMLLWLRGTNFERDVRDATARFQEKYGQKPDTLWLRPESKKGLTIEFDGLEIKGNGTITPGHFGLSREGNV